MSSLRIICLGAGQGWHASELQIACSHLGHELTLASYESIRARVGDGMFDVHSSAGSFSDYDVVLARTMPSGSFERITFRLAVLHELEFQRSGKKTGLGSPSGRGRTPLVVNPPRSLELAIDKFATLSRVVTLGYQVPETIVAQDRNEALEAFKQLGGDCVVKPVFGGEGRGVMRVQEEELAWYAFSTLEQVDALFYIQKFYPPGGMDIRLLVIGSRVIGVRRTNPNDFRTNRVGGGKSEAFVVTDDLRELAVNICQDLGLVYGAVDLLENEHGETKVVEVNAIPGWKGAQRVTPFSIAEGIITTVADLAVHGGEG